MPTGKKSAKAKPAKASKPASGKVPPKASPKKKTAKPVKAVKPAAKKPETKVVPSAAARAREKKLNELFGPSFPKGKGLNTNGEPISAEELDAQGWSLLQFPPPEGRMSWIYATHGLSAMKPKGAEKPTRIELVIHWREKHVLPLKLLNEAARHILETGVVPEPGQILSAQDGFSINVELAKHCVTIEAAAEDGKGGGFTPLILIGISDAELEFATRVRAELADGRQVLTEALRLGGIVPVTDPKRQCLTRRRDFNKIWETAFRTVRERKG